MSAEVVVAIVAVLVTLFGAFLTVQHFASRQREKIHERINRIHDRIGDILKDLPENFVSRRELNGRVDSIREGIAGY